MSEAEYWLDELPRPGEAESVACPKCGCFQWTACPRPYGLELACFRCPTYVGVFTVWSAGATRRLAAGLKGQHPVWQWLPRWIVRLLE